MATEDFVQTVSRYLFAENRTQIFAVLDGASVPDLRMSLHQYQAEYVCLYRGELAPDMAEVAPYLVRLESKAEFTNWIIRRGWGNHWGIFLESPASLQELRRHYRRFLIVYNEQGTPLYFRYYDPRVLRVYLLTCNELELQLLFGPVIRYYSEGEDRHVLVEYSLTDSALAQRIVPVADLGRPSISRPRG
jgi:hypothetical protein